MFNQTISTASFFSGSLQQEFRKTVKKVKRIYSGYTQLKEAENISRHFANYFQPVIGNTAETLEASAKIRHEVFCDELELFDKNESGIETDSYDSFSQQCLIQHTESSEYAGTLRLITPDSKAQVLPIIKIAGEHITDMQYHPSNFAPEETLEISRISIPKAFRRRNIDKHEGAAQAVINKHSYSEIELRCFPLIAVGLYMACAAYASVSKRKHVFFMVEPRLAKSIRHIGLHLKQIGNEFEYVGTRAPYYMEYESFMSTLKPSFKFMMNQFIKKIR